MASTYLTQRKQEIESDKNAAVYVTTSDYQNRIYQLEQSRPKAKSSSSSGDGVCALGVVGVILTIATQGIFLIVVAIGIVIKLVLDAKKEHEVEEANHRIDQQIDELNRQMKSEIANVRKSYDQQMAREETAFKNKVKAAQAKYGGRTTSKPIVNWLVDRFDRQIRLADRGAHVKNISVTFSFRVEAPQVCTLKYVSSYSGPGYYGADEIFDLTQNRFNHLNDFTDRVGFSRAMAKLVQLEMMNRYPKDPLAPTAAKPVISITSDDDTMHITYSVVNGNYRHAVTL